MTGVVIRGGGIAAHGCARLLRAARMQVRVETIDRPRLPALMLSETTQILLRDVFGPGDLFGRLPRIRKRVVCWGPNSEPVSVSHSAVVVSEQCLLDTLGGVDGGREDVEADWTVIACRPLPEGAVEHHFGSRMATAVAVDLKNGTDAEACWIESLENGWLFLIPGNSGSGWLLSVGGPPDSLLGASRLIAEQIVGCGAPAGEFPAYPRIVWPLCGQGWLACGTAALAFDPLCGDGTGHAIREAILTSAVIRAIASGGDEGELLAHYEQRLVAGFMRHLAACREYYTAGRAWPWWDSELESIQRGVAWCESRLGAGMQFRYQLRGFELQAPG